MSRASPKSLGLYLATIRYLKLSQIVYRIYYALRPRSVLRIPRYGTRIANRSWKQSIPRERQYNGIDSFDILNRHVRIDGEERWNNEGYEDLVLYHLHYLDDLLVNDGEGPCSWQSGLINAWIRDNPPPYGKGWDPYTISRRVVNMVKWAVAGNEMSAAQKDSLAQQAQSLASNIEYHILANHLFANGKALFFVGCYLNGGRADSWRECGRALIRRELREQMLPDGGHFELSPMYHAILLEDVLDMINLGRMYDEALAEDLSPYVDPMLKWLAHLSRSDGRPAHFNDSTAGIAPSLDELQAYALRLGHLEQNVGRGMSFFDSSGYFRFVASNYSMIGDIGKIGPDYQPGHGHCDCLSFELEVDRAPVLVNRGVSTYEIGSRRRGERSTAAHNTVTVDGLEQSDVWQSFRVGRRAKPFNVRASSEKVEASHDGYRSRGVVHTRQFAFDESAFRIRDRLESSGQRLQSGSAHLHFHPDAHVVLEGGYARVGPSVFRFEGAHDVSVQEYYYAEGFNKTRLSTKLVISFEGQLEIHFRYAHPVHFR